MKEFDTSEEKIEDLLKDLYIAPRKNLLKWSRRTKQTAQVRLGYAGQHVASAITGVKGIGTAARGDDLSDGTEVKSCSRADQLSECKDCEAKVMVWQEQCPECGYKNIDIKTDSHWIFRIDSEKELNLLTEKIPRLVMIMFDRKSIDDDDIRLRAWLIDPEQWYVQAFFKDYYKNNYRKKESEGKSPAPCNLHPLKYDFYMMAPELIFKAEMDIDNEDVEIKFWDLEDPKKEKFPVHLITKNQLDDLFEEQELIEYIEDRGLDEEYIYTRDGEEKVKNLQKADYKRIFDYLPEDKRGDLEMKDKKTKTYNQEYQRR